MAGWGVDTHTYILYPYLQLQVLPITNIITGTALTATCYTLISGRGSGTREREIHIYMADAESTSEITWCW